MATVTPKWLKRLRKKKKREVSMALGLMAIEAQLKHGEQIAAMQRQRPKDVEEYWRGDGWKGWV